MTGISQISSKSLPAADQLQHGPSQASQGITGPDTDKLPKAQGVSVSSFAVSWAKKYYSTVATRENQAPRQILPSLDLTNFEGNRAPIVEKLTDTLNLASEIAWSRVEALLGKQIERHAINPSLINSLEIPGDSRTLYRKAIDAYADREPVFRLSVLVGKDIIKVRRKYSETDPLVLGFVTMQFQYTS
ncbi:hypothetical protein Q5688_04360, partial [Microcoleus sp. herbarium5]